MGASLPTQLRAYPVETFVTQPTQRRVRFTSIGSRGGTSVFSGLTMQDITRQPSPTSSRMQVLSDDKAALTKGGYDFSVEGFLNAARAGDMAALARYLRSGMEP